MFLKNRSAVFFYIIFSACSKQLRPVKADTSYYNIHGISVVDTAVLEFIQPYHDSLVKEMDVVVAKSATIMAKGKPESPLGNFVADLLLEKGRAYNDGIADFCVVNYGGLRVPSLPAGEITRGMVYELMPFDNFLVILQLKGNVVLELVKYIASQGGWPIAGINFKIHDGNPFEILINNLPLQPDKNYDVVISDYLADGGDNLSMLKAVPRKSTGVFIRDVILEYLTEQTEKGKLISSKLDGRIIVE